MCGQCAKKGNRACKWRTQDIRFKAYRPAQASSQSTSIREGEAAEPMTEPGLVRNSPAECVQSASRSDNGSGVRSEGSFHALTTTSPTAPAPTFEDFSVVASPSLGPTLEDAQYSLTPLALTHSEASLVHRYTEQLSRWLDGTDGSRQFRLDVPGELKHCPILRFAVLCLAARHHSDDDAASTAYGQAIAPLIHRLNEDLVSHNDTLLCAIVILHFCDQLCSKQTTLF